MRISCPLPSHLYSWIRQPLSLVLVLTALVLIGCTPSGNAGTGNELGDSGIQFDLSASQPVPLVGTRWLLTSFPHGNETMPIPSDPFPYLLFKEKFLVIETGCNDIDGRYRVDEQQLTIEMSLLRGVGCNNIVSSEAVALELPIHDTLSTWKTYRIEGNDLFIQFSGGEIQFSNLIPTSPSLLSAFPFQEGEEEAQAQETQSVEGELRLVDGCLRIVPPESGDEQGYLVIWRSDHAIGLEESTLAVYDTYGERVGDQLARVGNQVSLRGKAVEQDELEMATPAILQLPSPAECPGPYWLLDKIK